MFDKNPFKRDVSKLRAILLLEDDLNSLYKIMFNRRILLALEKNKLIPMEIVGGHNGQYVIHVAINKKLLADISNQVKALSTVISADDTNYYDRVAHHFASLTTQNFCVHIDYVLVLLKAIQFMHLFLQTSFVK